VSRQLVCTFSLAGNTFGVPVAQVQEVIRSLEITPVPLAPPAVRGMLNLRGQIVTAIDLRRRLHLGDRGADDRKTNYRGANDHRTNDQPMHVVVPTRDGPVSLLVDDVGDVIEVARDAAEPPPETIDAAVRPLVEGVYQLPDRLLLVLDVDRASDVGKDASVAGKPPY
jgi:purine-binding chemotaxis protein CheW